MSWVMKAKILDIKEAVVYSANKEYMRVARILYKWEVVK